MRFDRPIFSSHSPPHVRPVAKSPAPPFVGAARPAVHGPGQVQSMPGKALSHVDEQYTSHPDDG